MNPFEEGFQNALAGGWRSDNPYARGWSRLAVLVMPDSLSAVWDDGWRQGRKSRESIGQLVDKAVWDDGRRSREPISQVLDKIDVELDRTNKRKS